MLTGQGEPDNGLRHSFSGQVSIRLPRTITESLHDNFTILQQLAAKLILEQSMVKNPPIPTNYHVILEELKCQVHTARMRATLAANSELVGLYLEIGRKILEQQRQEGWGTGVIGKLADDLRAAFPDMKGFSPAICPICDKLLKFLAHTQFCNKLLQNCPGDISWCSSTSSRRKTRASGTAGKP